jgi:hypothetical protein
MTDIGRIWKAFQFFEFARQNDCVELSLFEFLDGWLVVYNCDSIRSNKSIFPIAVAFWFSFRLCLQPIFIFKFDSHYFFKNKIKRKESANCNQFSRRPFDQKKSDLSTDRNELLHSEEFEEFCHRGRDYGIVLMEKARDDDQKFLIVGVLEHMPSTFESSKAMLESLAIFKFHSEYVFQNKIMHRNSLSNWFEITKKSADWNQFSKFFFGRTQSELATQRNAEFQSCDCFFGFEANENFGQGVCDCWFDWTKRGTERKIDEEDGANSLRTEMNQIRQLLQESGGSNYQDDSTLVPSVSPRFIEIGRRIQIIQPDEFTGLEQLNRVSFESGSQVKEIDGFQKCTSLCRIEFPSSLEIIGEDSFKECISLTEIIFPADSHLKAINGFRKCTSLCRMEFPSSLENIWSLGFTQCTSLSEIIFPSDSHLKSINGFRKCTSLCRIEFTSSLEIIGDYGF